MHQRPNPWRWPAATALALALLLGGVFFTPDSWIEFFFSPLNLGDEDGTGDRRGWLELLPPPEIVVAAEEPAPATKPDPKRDEPQVEWQNPDWWQEGWRIKMETETETALRPAPADSAAVVLRELGIGQDFFSMVKPDSVLAARLHLLKLEDSYRFDELKPFLSAMGRAAAYRDIMSRKADMYDEFLGREIIAPDAENR